jgi:hypothetical protein
LDRITGGLIRILHIIRAWMRPIIRVSPTPMAESRNSRRITIRASIKNSPNNFSRVKTICNATYPHSESTAINNKTLQTKKPNPYKNLLNPNL